MLFNAVAISNSPYAVDVLNCWYRLEIMPVCHGLGSMDGSESDA